MQKDARAYGTTWVIFSASMVAFAIIYSIQQHIPPGIAVPFTAAAVVEIGLYLVPGFTFSRACVESFQPVAFRALAIELSTLVPYLIYSIGTGTFHWLAFALLAALTTVVATWYVVLPRKHLAVDLLLLAVIGAVFLLKIFPSIYITLAPRAEAAILGQLMWFRLHILSVLCIRRMGGIGFGFLPARKDWAVGTQHYLMFLPVAVVCGMGIGFAQPHAAFTVWWKGVALAVGTFAGFLWVVGLWEEFLFRGMLQQLLSKALHSKLAGLVAAAVVFGLSHLPFRHFPNWRFALLAGIAGLFYGWAYRRAASVRAAAVTHALVVTTWRVFFS